MNEMDRMKDQVEQSYGKRLQEARLNAGLSTESVAESLRLDPRFVVALEKEDTDTLPAPTFTRGYIRAYAQLVRCNADELIAEYNVHAGSEPELTDTMAAAVEQPNGEPMTFWITLMVVGVLIALLALWAYDSLGPLNLQAGEQLGKPAAQTEPLASPVAPDKTEVFAPDLAGSSDATSSDATLSDATGQIQITGDPRQSDVPGPLLSAGAEVEPGMDENRGLEEKIFPSDSVVEIDDEVTFAGDAAATAASETDSEVVPTAPQGSDVLRLSFRGRSWAEIVDANSFQLAYGMFENRTLEFEGQAPFRVMLGDATQVDVIVNGTKVGLKPYIRWNKTANLSVGQPANGSD